MELLLSSITNTDTLIRSYKETCSENNQLKKNLQSITESSVRITNLYQMEKEQCGQLAADKERLEAKLKQMQAKMSELTHRQLNEESIHKQSIAELEEQVKNVTEHKHSDYIDLCKQFVVQGNTLHEHGLASPQLRKKHRQVIELLKQRGEKFEETKGAPVKRPTGTEAKTTNCSIATMTETVMSPPATGVRVCDKATMHRMSTATRSTCTSVFIKKMDASTSTDSLNSLDQNVHVRNIFKTIIPHPPLLSPIKSMAAPTRKPYRNQCTMTPLQNVCKEIGYSHSTRPMNAIGMTEHFASPVRTKEECTDAFASRSSLLSSLSTQRINPELALVWQILGDTIFTMVGNGRIFNDDSPGFNGAGALPPPPHTRSPLDCGIGESFYKLKEELAKLSSLNEPVPHYSQLDINTSDTNGHSSEDGVHNFDSESNYMPNESISRKSPPIRMSSSSQRSAVKAVAAAASTRTSNSTVVAAAGQEHRHVQRSKRSKKFVDLFGPTKRIKLKRNVSKF